MEEPAATEEPVTTEEPAATEEPLPTEEPAATEEPLPTEEAPAEQPLPERSLSITSNIPADEVEIGDVVHLTAILNGYEGAEVSIAWERLVDGVWQPTGDTGRLVEFTVDEENLHGSWRFTATVISEAQPAAEEAAQ